MPLSTIKWNRVHIREAAPPPPPPHTTTAQLLAVPATMQNPIQQLVPQRSTPSMPNTEYDQLAQPLQDQTKAIQLTSTPRWLYKKHQAAPQIRLCNPRPEIQELNSDSNDSHPYNMLESPRQIHPEVRTHTRKIKQPAWLWTTMKGPNYQ